MKKELLARWVLCFAMSAATDGAMVRFDADSRAATVAKASPTVKLGELQAQILAAKATLKRAQLDKRNDCRAESSYHAHTQFVAIVVSHLTCTLEVL